MAVDLVTLGATLAVLNDSQGAQRAGTAGSQITSHLGIVAFALTTTAITPSSKVLVGFSLVHTGRFRRRTLGAAFPRQVNELRSLWAFDTSTLGPVTEDLTPAAGTELAAGAVPHVSMVTHCALVLAASLSSSAFITALPGTLHFGLPLVAGYGWAGFSVAFRLTSVTHARGAGVLLPLLTALVLFSS